MGRSGWRVVLSWPDGTDRAGRFTEQSHHDTLIEAWPAYYAARRKLADLKAFAQVDLIDSRTGETLRTEWNKP